MTFSQQGAGRTRKRKSNPKHTFHTTLSQAGRMAQHVQVHLLTCDGSLESPWWRETIPPSSPLTYTAFTYAKQRQTYKNKILSNPFLHTINLYIYVGICFCLYTRKVDFQLDPGFPIISTTVLRAGWLPLPDSSWAPDTYLQGLQCLQTARVLL